jgi:hypothetical protein
MARRGGSGGRCATSSTRPAINRIEPANTGNVIEARTAPAVQPYAQAVAEHRRAEQDRSTHHTLVQLDGLSVDVPAAANRVHALELWERWASGTPLPDRQLHLTLQVLGQMPPTGHTRHLIDQLATDPVITATRSQRSRTVNVTRTPTADSRSGPDDPTGSTSVDDVAPTQHRGSPALNGSDPKGADARNPDPLTVNG